MAKIFHCGRDSRATAYRLASSKPAYRFQHLWHCDRCHVCKEELMQWRGEYLEGDKFTAWIDVPEAEFAAWKRRIKAGEAKPEAQLMSEWAERAARPADIAIYYHNTIQQAKRWCNGVKV